MLTRRIALVSAAVATIAVACAGKKSAGPTAMWSADATSVANPWPSDRLLAGGVAGTPPGYFSRLLDDTPKHATARAFLNTAQSVIASAGGYSVYAPIILRMTATVDTALVAPDVHLWSGTGADVAVDVSWSDDFGALLVSPVLPLKQQTTYELAIASPAIAASGDFAHARTADAATSALAAAAVAHGAAATVADVALAIAVTTQPVAGGLQSAQARIDAIGDSILPDFDPADEPGSLTNSGFVVGVYDSGSAGYTQIFTAGGAKTTDIATVAQGTWPAFEFRGADQLFDPSYLDGTTMPGTTPVDFRLTIPVGVAPTAGWPIAIVGHGVSGDSTEALQRAYSFAEAGMAVIGLTAPDHGWRGSFLTFFDFTRLLAVRDEFRQSQVEVLQMQRMVANARAAGTAPFDRLDPARITYFGNSFGGLVGGGVAASSTHLQAIGLTVAGGRLLRLLDGEAGQGLLIFFSAKMAVSVTDPQWPRLVASLRELGQWAVDPCDGGALAPYAPVQHLLLQESLADQTILNPSTEDLRASYGLPILSAPADPFSGRGAMWVWDITQFSSEVPAGTHAHDIYWDVPEMRHQMEQFLKTGGGRIIDQ